MDAGQLLRVALALALATASGCEVAGKSDGSCSTAADCRDGLLCVSTGIHEGLGECVRVVAADPGSVYTDPATRLEWQQTPTGGNMDWESAVIHCRNLELEGTGWRLPSIDELRSLLRGCPATGSGGACGATNTCLIFDACLTDCAGCEDGAGPTDGCYWPEGLGGSCTWYWSASSLENREGAWYVVFSYAHVCGRSPDQFGLVRCVR